MVLRKTVIYCGGDWVSLGNVLRPRERIRGSGETVDITMYGTSEQFSNYMTLLLDVSGGGGPFSTAPAKVKGNILNTTDAKNIAFCCFRLSQMDFRSYLVE